MCWFFKAFSPFRRKHLSSPGDTSLAECFDIEMKGFWFGFSDFDPMLFAVHLLAGGSGFVISLSGGTKDIWLMYKKPNFMRHQENVNWPTACAF